MQKILRKGAKIKITNKKIVTKPKGNKDNTKFCIKPKVVVMAQLKDP